MARLKRVHYRIIDVVLVVLIIVFVAVSVYFTIQRDSAKKLYEDNLKDWEEMSGDMSDKDYKALVAEVDELTTKINDLNSQLTAKNLEQEEMAAILEEKKEYEKLLVEYEDLAEQIKKEENKNGND